MTIETGKLDVPPYTTDTAYSERAVEQSIAISLKRIADSLEKLVKMKERKDD